MFDMEDNSVYAINYYCAHGEQTAINVVHYYYRIGADRAATSTEIMGFMSDIAGPKYETLLCIEAQYRGVSIQKVQPLPVGVIEYLSDPIDGAVAGDLLPRQTCGLITKVPTTGTAFRKGRMYIPFPSETDNDSGSLPIAGYQTRLEAFAADVLASRNFTIGTDDIGGLDPVLFRKSDLGYSFVTGWSTRRRWATQRRRGSYGRANLSPV